MKLFFIFWTATHTLAQPSTLLVYYSSLHQDNVVCTESSCKDPSLDSSYAYYSDDLSVYSNSPGANLAPLNFYFNSETKW